MSVNRSAWLVVLMAVGAASAATVTVEPIARSTGTVRDTVPGRGDGFVFRGQSQIQAPVVNDSGEVVFLANSSAAPSTAVDPAVGIYVNRPGTGLDVLVDTTVDGTGAATFAVPGQPADTQFVAGGFLAPLLNNAGDVVFFATFSGPTAGTGEGLYATNTSAGSPIVKIVDTSDSVPGHPAGTLFDNFSFISPNPARLPISLNDAGQVVFWAQFCTLASCTSSTLSNGIFGTTVSGGTAVLLADSTETVIPTGKTNGFNEIRPEIGINSSGIVVFHGRLAPASVSPAGVFAIPVTGGVAPTTVAFRVQSAPPDHVVSFNDTFQDVDINDAGVITFLVGLSDGESGMFAGDVSGGPLTRLVDTRVGGMTVPETPGAEFDTLAFAAINESGNAGFFSFIRDSGTSNNQGIYVAGLDGDPIELALDEDGIAPGLPSPAHLTNFKGRSAAINDDGHLAFWGTGLNDLGTVLFGLYFYDACTKEAVRIADTTTALADLGSAFTTSGSQKGEFVLYQSGEVRNGHYRTINNSNDVVFAARFNNFDFGVYVAHIEAGGGPLTITCPADVTAECPAGTLPDVTGEATAEGCGTITVTYADESVTTCGGAETITRTWSAVVGSDDPVSCVQTITVVDTAAPVLSGVPADVTVNCDAVPAAATVTATDACDAAPVVVFDEVRTDGTCADDYVLTRTWTATDACGNVASASQTITVVDTTAPVLSGVPADATVNCDAVPAAATVTATDACDAAPTVVFDEVRTDGTCADDYVLTRTWIATDSCGNVASESQTITVVDTSAPVLSGVPADVTVNCDAVPAAATVTATDACDAAPVVVFDEVRTDGTCPAEFVLTRTWSAVDECGNEVNEAQIVSVADVTAPALTCPADVFGLECPADTSVTAYGTATASDNCGAVTIESSDVTTETCGDAETVTRTFTAYDDCGNPASCVQTIETVDTTPPTFPVVPDPVFALDIDCSGDEAITLSAVVAEDDCDSEVTVSADTPALFPAGATTTVTYTATDDCANTAETQQEVTVDYGAGILVSARKFVVGWGHRPCVTRGALSGIAIGAYDESPGSCAANQIAQNWGVLWWSLPDIVANCTPVNSGVTNAAGVVVIDVPPGDYVVATHFDSDDDGDLDQYLGQYVSNVSCGETAWTHLFMIHLNNGRRFGCKFHRFTGSELLVIEPEEVVWDGTEQLYPFVFDSEGDWGVTVSVTPPDGFVADYDELSEEVNTETEALQFTITEVGSDLLPTITEFEVHHGRKTHTLRSEVGIALTPEYARQRGFNVGRLQQRGLIVDDVHQVRRSTLQGQSKKIAPRDLR